MDVIAQPGGTLSHEIATGDRADAQIDAFISKRDEKRRKDEGEQATEDLWKAATLRQEAARRRENIEGWYGWHLARADLYGRMSAEHAGRAEKLMEETDDRSNA